MGTIAGNAIVRQTWGKIMHPRGHDCFYADTHIMENTWRNLNNAALKLKAIKLAFKEGTRATVLNIINWLWRLRMQWEELSQGKKMAKAFRRHKDTEEDHLSGISAQGEDENSDQWHFWQAKFIFYFL